MLNEDVVGILKMPELHELWRLRKRANWPKSSTPTVETNLIGSLGHRGPASLYADAIATVANRLITPDIIAKYCHDMYTGLRWLNLRVATDTGFIPIRVPSIGLQTNTLPNMLKACIGDALGHQLNYGYYHDRDWDLNLDPNTTTQIQNMYFNYKGKTTPITTNADALAVYGFSDDTDAYISITCRPPRPIREP
jgi:hypothetical protein